MERMMENPLDDRTIRQAGLRISRQPIPVPGGSNARIFEFPQLDNVFVMETDLYGNLMPKDSCFLAFYGHHGLIGQQLEAETLRNASLAEIRKIIQKNADG